MATDVFVNIRTTKLNQRNRFTVTYDEGHVPDHGPPLFDMYLTNDEVDELQRLVMEFAAQKFTERLT